MSRSLTEISRDLLLAQQEMDIFDSDELKDKIDELRSEQESKEDGLYFFYQDFNKEIELFTKQIEKAKRYVKFLKNEQERIKEYVVGQFQLTEALPKHSALNPIKVRKSSGAVDIIDEDDIPSEYWVSVTTLKLDKKRILKDLKEGKKIKGVRLAQKDFVSGLK